MTPQSMIKKLIWITALSWMFSGSAKAQCIHEPGVNGSFGIFHVPTQGDLLLFGLTVLLLWGFAAWMMNRFFPMSKYFGGADVNPVMQNEELAGLQAQTNDALRSMEAEYEEMILSRLDQVTDNKTSNTEVEKFRSQRAASV